MTPWAAVIALVYVLVVGACSVLAFSRGMWTLGFLGVLGVVIAIRGTVRLYQHDAGASHLQEGRDDRG